MSVVDQYLKWANATGNIILDWARPAGAPIGITSVSSSSVVVFILTHGYCTHYSHSDHSLISIDHQLTFVCTSQTWPLAKFSYAFTIALCYLGFVVVGRVRPWMLNYAL